MRKLNFPNNKKFAFTIIDDTDDAYLENIKPVYDVLYENGLKTTKTVWVYPVRDIKESKGDCLQRREYLDWVKDLKEKGFEIALHNVGSGDFKRSEILEGLEEYKEFLDKYPDIHINHSYNPDNIYCGSKRFSFPFNLIVKKFYSQYSNFSGEIPESEYFWGDWHKQHIRYSRNYEIDDINTLKINPYMPYRDKGYDEYANQWFSSTFASNQWVFNHQVNKMSIDRLEAEGGVCILYTHLGYYHKRGKVNEGFVKSIEDLGSRDTGWYVPVSVLLDFLSTQKEIQGQSQYLSPLAKFRLEYHSLKTRIKYRFLNKIDDYHFKLSAEYAEKD